MYFEGFRMPAMALLVLISQPVHAQSIASSDGKAGFFCKGINNTSSIVFNIDLKRKKIQWDSGDEDKIVVKQNEISVYRDPYVSVASNYMYSRTMDRTSLIYTSFYAVKSTYERKLLSYQCEIVPVHIFGGRRKF